MTTFDAEKYEILAIWECPECKEQTTSPVLENIEYGWPLCTQHSPDLPDLKLTLISYLIKNI